MKALKVRVYWNIHKKCYSVQHKGRVIMHCNSFLFLENVTLKVSAKGNARVRSEGKKNVHAFVCGTFVPGGVDVVGTERAITYNPYRYTTFVDKATEAPVYEAKAARLTVVKTADGNRPAILLSDGRVIVDDLVQIIDELQIEDIQNAA